MRYALRPSNRFVRRVAIGACAAICVTGGIAAGDDRPPAEDLLRIASDEPLIVRFATPVRASRVGSQSFRIGRESDGEPVHGRYFAGTFLMAPLATTSDVAGAVVIDPEAFIEAVQVVRGVDRATASSLVEKNLARYSQTGRRESMKLLTDVLRDLSLAMPNGAAFDPELMHVRPEYFRRSLPQQDADAPEAARALRKIQAGDDALWEDYLIHGNLGAFAALADDPANARFHHSTDPLTGKPYAESDYRRRDHRRYLFTGARSGRVFTFVPDIPVAADESDAAFAPNEQFRVTLAGLPAPLGGILTQSGWRAALRRRVAHLETTNPEHDTTFGDVYSTPVAGPVFRLSEIDHASFHLTDVTPPSGELLVDPTSDWESPDNMFTVPIPERRPFVVRVRFNQPLDPRSVTKTSFTLTQTRAFVGAADEHDVSVPVPVDVRLTQTRLGDVEVDLRPVRTLDPAAAYEVRIRDLVLSLTGKWQPDTLRSTFTTASVPSQYDVLLDDFKAPDVRWVEADTATPRALVAADAAHDPEGSGRFVPFLGDDPVPVTAIETGWLDSRFLTPRYFIYFGNAITGHLYFHAPPGSSVRFFARTTGADVSTGAPRPDLARPWVELDPASPELVGGFTSSQFLQLRIEFTLPAGATPDTADLPYVDNAKVFVRVP